MTADPTALQKRIRRARSVPAEWARLREGESTREQIERHQRRMDEQIAALIAAEVQAAQEPTDAEQAVRWLHREREWRPLDGTFIGGTVCNACRRPYPCPTISILDEPARAARRDEEDRP